MRGASSRGICYAQKTLEIFERLGIYERILRQGHHWSVGKTFSGDERGLQLRPAGRQTPRCQPPFINLQQFYIEWFLVDRIRELGAHGSALEEPRHAHRAARRRRAASRSRRPPATTRIEADYVIDATGANSPIREQLGLEAHASRSTDRWCISDVRFGKPLPVERWTWVDAPFNEGRGVWQHLMADGVWRMDYQMAPDCDPEAVSRPEVAGARLRAQLGPDVEFEFVWVGPYSTATTCSTNSAQGRVFFIGDCGARGQPLRRARRQHRHPGCRQPGLEAGAGDCKARPPAALLDSYYGERRHAAAAERAGDQPHRALPGAAQRRPSTRMRRAVMHAGRRYPFARPLVNTGRMSVASAYPRPHGCPRAGARCRTCRCAGRRPRRHADATARATARVPRPVVRARVPRSDRRSERWPASRSAGRHRRRQPAADAARHDAAHPGEIGVARHAGTWCAPTPTAPPRCRRDAGSDRRAWPRPRCTA